ncbi:uncharacterized protein [Miscanthus floridulus]|uniref:uncharacterized protein n=1 Tax=Miscanthus floridulus TaxID=154761 RepID=UPI00345A384F
MRIGSDRSKKATAQLLKQEYANLKFKDGESVEDFSLYLQMLISKLKSHGVTINEEEAVSKLSVAVDKHLEQAISTKDNGKLLLIEEEWAARRNSRVASSSCGGDGKRHSKASSEKKKQVGPNTCRRYGKIGHWARECPNHKQDKMAKAHLAQASDDDEATILMVTFCTLHDVEAKEKGEVMAVKRPRKALKAVNLDEPHAQVHLGRVGGEQEQRWYLDSGASNHMTGSKVAFSKLDDDVTGTVKFGDGSRVAIQGHGTILFRC